ncbi:GNAT family N-acetyltransferase [Halovenus sp. WSH3]|uniref:GNAT family N-acetyltransferase n=1 Tax=Halovenus carboxidivorans TaxID=2692199 RepID=A0A6B0T7E6_9EURY|nr:GNAT family N-acetyltransferase [Halovenus carboxidivorans]MXR51513.1 GNAT family N-acetyltransferase [Halovenus carboxidivorans]
MTAFRRVPESDSRRYREILRYAFAPEEGPLDEEGEEWPPGPFDPYGLYDGGRLRSTCKLYDLDAWLREGTVRIGGLGAVATLPEDRRQGYVRELCRHALDVFEERGARLVVLWPFETAFYAAFGWATAHDERRYECPPAALPSHDSAGRMRRFDPDEWERLREAEQAHGEGVALSLRRSPAWWSERTLTNWTGGTQPYIYGYERGGEVAGYLTYTVDDSGTLAVDTLAYADEEAYRAILSVLGRHGAQIERVEFTRPDGTSLLDRIDEPERVDCAVGPGPMVRLPSVFALDGTAWPETGLDCRLAVSDPLESEPAVVRVQTTDGTLRVSTADGSPAVRTDIGTLSQLVVGTYGVERARRLDAVTVDDERVLEELSATFEEQQVFLGEFF